MTSWASGLWNQADGQMPRIEDLWKIAWDLRNCSSARCSLFRCVVKLQGRFIFQFLLCTSAVCWDSPLPLHFRTCKPDTVKRSISGLYGSYTGIQFLFPKHAHFGDTAGRGKAVTSCTWTSASPWSTGSNTTSTSKGVLWVCWSIVSLYSSMFFQHKFMMIFRSYLNIYIYMICLILIIESYMGHVALGEKHRNVMLWGASRKRTFEGENLVWSQPKSERCPHVVFVTIQVGWSLEVSSFT